MSLPRVSELMRPVERAKLVISLELKGMQGSDAEVDRTIEGEIKQVVGACPSSQVQDYNFFISLKDRVWRMLMMIELNQSFLETLDAKMMLIRYLLVMSPTIDDSLKWITGRSGDEVDREFDAAKFQLESLAQMKTEGDILTIINPKFMETLQNFKFRFGERVSEIRNYTALIEKIEQKYFEGMEIVSRDSKQPTGVIPRAKKAIEDVLEVHNRELRQVVESFNLLGMVELEYKWEQLEELLLEDNNQADEVWVEKRLAEVEEEERR